jgi:hypothetical protein
MSRETVILGGSVAQRPGHGGHTWVFLQYLLGLKGLGWDVVLVDRLEPDMCRDERGRPCAVRDSVNLRYLEKVMESFGLGDAYALIYDGGTKCHGMTRGALTRKAEEAAVLLNVNGFITDEEILGRVPLRAFVDIDPGFGHMWHDLGLHEGFRGHDAYVTVGENVGTAECTIPTCGLEWLTTAQPVVLDQWPAQNGTGDRFTSVGAWRGPYGPLEYRGRTYGLRVHEFRKFVELPSRSKESFEVALEIDPVEVDDLALLRANGWTLVDPAAVAGDPWAYQRYVQSSKAELMVAKNIYVDSNSGWFSDRSICYLASGKPVVAQDTGFTRHYPTGEGLLAFNTLDEALQCVEEVSRDYRRHALAARSLAEEYFDSRKVLTRLLALLGVNGSTRG